MGPLVSLINFISKWVSIEVRPISKQIFLNTDLVNWRDVRLLNISMLSQTF